MSYPTTSGTIGQPFILLATVDSTNNYAMAQVHAGMASPGTVYFAMEQTEGKGQRGRTWVSEPGQNIVMSVNLRPGALRIDQAFLLSAAISLGCYDFYKSFAGDDTSIKWPNDLYWRDRKAGGILIENIVSGAWTTAIAGIGINVNQTVFAADQSKAVSLKQITGQTFDVVALAGQLCKTLEKRVCQLDQSEELLRNYNEVLFMRNRTVRLKHGPKVFETLIRSVDANGTLITGTGVENRFSVGEVSWLID